MSTQVLMSLGGNFFHAPRLGEASPGFDSISRDSSFTWTTQGRLSRDPALQFTGPGEEVISIEGRLFPHMFGGLKTLDALREAGRAGQPLMLTRYYVLSDPIQYVAETIGKFVIRRIRKNETHIASHGLAHKVDFTLELAMYGEDSSDTPEFLFSMFGDGARTAEPTADAPAEGVAT